MMAKTDTPTSPPRVPHDLLASTQFLLKRVGMAAKERALAEYDRAGFSPYHHAVLAFLSEDSPDTQGEIADALGYDRGQLVGLLDELEEKGLVERRRDPDDRRRHIVRVTPAGGKALARLRGIAAGLDDEFLGPLDDTERATLHGLLARLAEHHDPRCAPQPPA